MNEHISISCVIPTHNRPDLLRESIGSALAQTTSDPYEIVVVDDVGDDATRSVVNEVAGDGPLPPIRYLARRGPSGASASRNFAAAAANGEYLAFLDDDDFWDPRFIEASVAAMALSDADMAVTWLNVLDVDGSIRPLYRLPLNLAPSTIAAKNTGFTGSNFIIKKTVFLSLGGFDPNLAVSNDKDFIVRFLLGGFRYTVVPEYLSTHRRHAGPQLTVGDERRATGVEAYLRKHHSILTWNGKRFLRKRIHRIRSRTSPNRTDRMLHAIKFIASLSVSDVKSKWHRRDGRYSELG